MAECDELDDDGCSVIGYNFLNRQLHQACDVLDWIVDSFTSNSITWLVFVSSDVTS